MILINKGSIKLYLGISLYFLIQLSVILLTSKDSPNIWLNRVFADKVFVFLVIPIFLLGLGVIDKCSGIYYISRIEDRKKILINKLLNQYFFIIIYLTIWFSLINIFLIVSKHDISYYGLLRYINNYFITFIILVLVVNVKTIISKLNMKISEISYFITLLLVFVDLQILYPLIRVHLSRGIYIFFSFVYFTNGIYQYVYGFILILLTSLLLILTDKNEDIYK